MAEALAVLSLVAAIAQLVDFSGRVVSRLNEFNSWSNDVPETFRSLAVQLPLLRAILQGIQSQAQAGHVDVAVVKALEPIIEETKEQAELLNAELSKIIPPQSAKTLERGLTALKSLAVEGRVKKALAKLHNCINVLVLHQTTTGIDLSSSILSKVIELGKVFSPTTLAGDTPKLLHEAARQGDISSIRVMLRLGADIQSRDASGMSPLHTAVLYNQKDVVNFLCRERDGQKRADIDDEDNRGRTPLHIAIIAGNLGVAGLLRQRGASDDITDDDHKTPLQYAENKFIASWQMRNGTGIESRDPMTGNTALIQASVQADIDAVKLLLAMDADIDARNTLNRTALIEACCRCHTQIIDQLLQHGADPNLTDHIGWSALTRCVGLNQREALVQLLKCKRVDLEARNATRQRTALVEATYNCQWSLASVLLDHGANSNATGEHGPLLRYLVQWCRDEEILRKFLQHNIDIEATNSSGFSPMTEAVHNKNWTCMDLLLEHGASPNGKHESYPYICRLAQWNVDVRWIRSLIRHGARLEETNPAGWTALRESTAHAHVSATHELLVAGADANDVVQGKFHQFGHHANTSILQSAIWRKDFYEQVVPELLANGARLEHKDDHGWTALRLAIERGHDDVACMLFLRGADVHSEAHDGQTALDRAQAKKLRDFCTLIDMEYDV